jgi:hypothetical protein
MEMRAHRDGNQVRLGMGTLCDKIFGSPCTIL